MNDLEDGIEPFHQLQELRFVQRRGVLKKKEKKGKKKRVRLEIDNLIRLASACKSSPNNCTQSSGNNRLMCSLLIEKTLLMYLILSSN